MSLFGIWHNNYHVSPHETNVMMNAISDQYTDQTDIWHHFNTAIGQKTMFNTPQSCLENLPRHIAERNLTIAGDISIDNRPELFAQLGISPVAKAGFGDAALINEAYLKRGDSCAERLLGSFAFVTWDGNKTNYCVAQIILTKRACIIFNEQLPQVEQYLNAIAPNDHVRAIIDIEN